MSTEISVATAAKSSASDIRARAFWASSSVATRMWDAHTVHPVQRCVGNLVADGLGRWRLDGCFKLGVDLILCHQLADVSAKRDLRNALGLGHVPERVVSGSQEDGVDLVLDLPRPSAHTRTALLQPARLSTR